MTRTATGDARFARSTVTVRVAQDALDAWAPVRRFLEPHVEFVPATGNGESSTVIEVVGRPTWRRPSTSGESTLVRRRASGGHVHGSRWHSKGRTTIHVAGSDTVLDLSDDGSHARLFMAETSRYHVGDFVRDVLWELASGYGTFIHAAAVSTTSGVVAITGPKGAGKTTTAVDLIGAGYHFYTGDALFLMGEVNETYSFPDYPHVGWGTMRSAPALLGAAAQAGCVPGADDAKVLLPHDVYETALGATQDRPPLPLRAVVLSDLAGSGGVTASDDAQGAEEAVAPMERQTSDPGEGWEPFLAALPRTSGGPRTPDWVTGPDVAWFSRRGRQPLTDADHQQLAPSS